jgi:hypothetical protein
VDELLYWIPFLRWAQAATYGLRERLVVVSRETSAAWYAGIGSTHVAGEDILSDEQASRLAGTDDVVVVPAGLVAERRSELAAGERHETFLRRRLEFAPLAAPELPEGLELPDDFVAVCFEARRGEIGAALASRVPVVELNALDRTAQTAVLARARGFVGGYGVEAYLAVLLGVPAVAFSSGSVAADYLRVVSSFLDRPPFGPLHVVEAGASAAEDAERAARLLEAPLALAR